MNDFGEEIDMSNNIGHSILGGCYVSVEWRQRNHTQALYDQAWSRIFVNIGAQSYVLYCVIPGYD